jgi:hypothetical protein
MSKPGRLLAGKIVIGQYRTFATTSAKSGCEQSQQANSLFDDIVGGGTQQCRYIEAEGAGGLG